MRLIDADALLEQFSECNFKGHVLKNLIEAQPTIDPASLRPKGEWIFQMSCYEVDECACSACGQLLTTHARERANYCPNCGADMRGDNNEA